MKRDVGTLEQPLDGVSPATAPPPGPSRNAALPVVVVVDDEERTVTAASIVLRRRCHVLGALNGPDALELVRKHDVALVIADQRMPGMTGVELLEQVRVLSPRTKRAILSGYTDSSDLIDAINRGAVSRYLLKPVTAEALRELVSEEIDTSPVRPGTRVGLVGGASNHAVVAALAELSVEVVPLPAEALESAERLREEEIGLVLVELSDNEQDGAEQVLAAAARAAADTVLLVPQAAFYRAAALLRRGASDLVPMPIDPDALVAVVTRTLRRRTAESELQRQRVEASVAGELRGLVCSGRAMQRVVTAIQSVAPTDASVLLLGETGVGKEVVARAIHAASRRRAGSIVPVHCAALTGTLLESELFGHEKGAFTGATERRMGRFERAHGGTLFLDEVGDIPLDTQVKLLRVLQERVIERVGGSTPISVDVRVIAATHRDLEAMVAAGQFRRDLYYRLRVIPITIPPLRERKDEIRLLAEHFLRSLQKRDGKDGITLGPEALAHLEAHSWPGNVRELQNIIEQAVAYTPSGKPIDPALFEVPEPAPADAGAQDPGGFGADVDSVRSLQQTVDHFERHLLERIMTRHMGNQSRAAAQLGITRQALAKRLTRLGIRGRA